MSDKQNIKEVQRRVFDLTLALYRVTDFFPQGEVLKRNLREKANEVFGMITEFGYSGGQEQDSVLILGKIQSVRGYLELARSLRFVKPINITVLEREYDILADFFTPRPLSADSNMREAQPAKNEWVTEENLSTWEEFSLPSEEKLRPAKKEAKKEEDGFSHIRKDLNERQRVIVEHLKNSGQAKVSDFFPVFNGISSKTIQRDLQDLVGRNVLKKEGDKRWTIYALMSDSLSDI